MKNIKKLVMSVIIFGLCYSLEKIIFGLLFYSATGFQQNMFKETVFASVIGSINEVYPNDIRIVTLFAIQSITELIIFSVFTSYVFAYILNREPRIVFPDKLVIRHRTSEGSKGNLYLCIMIGNKSRTKIHNAVCTLSCYYIQENDPKKTNGEFMIKMEQPSIDNYFRFSCDVSILPKKIIKDFYSSNPIGLEHDVIKVNLSGNLNTLGNSFLLEKSYKISDITIGENYIDLKYDVVNPFTGKALYRKVKWKEIKRVDDIDKHKKQIIKKELKQIIDS